VNSLENERDEFERKYNKEKSNSEYLKSQIDAYKAEIEELKNKNLQLLNFTDSLGRLNTEQQQHPQANQEEYNKLKILFESKSEEVKGFKEEAERYKDEVKEWRKKLVEESEKNNEYVKSILDKNKNLQTKYNEFERKCIDFKKHADNNFQKKNEEIFKLQEKIKTFVVEKSKMKKLMVQKEIEIRSQVENQNLGNNKELVMKNENLRNEVDNLNRKLIDYEGIIKEKAKEVAMVYQKMEQIANQIETKQVDSNFKKLVKENSHLITENSKLEVAVNSLNDKLKRREKTIKELKVDRDQLTSKLSEYHRLMPSDEVVSSSSDNKENFEQLKSMERQTQSYLNKIAQLKHSLEMYASKLEQMEIINLALVTMNKQKIKYVEILKSWWEDIPESKEQKLVKIKNIGKQI
jgi:chromosome segregation ATPase